VRQAVTTGVGAMATDTAAPPVAGEHQVLVAVQTVGICGSDASFFGGTHPYLVYPQVQGHEVVGSIAQTAQDVAAAERLPVGTRVVVEPLCPCGQCLACRRGRSNCCTELEVLGIHRPGGLSDLMVVDAHRVHPIGELPDEAAVFVEPLAVALHSLSRAALQAGETVLVLGAGSIGRAAVLAAADLGARVLVADRSAHRLEATRRLGAEATVDVARGNVPDAVAAFTSGEGCRVVVEATGSASLLREALDVVAHSGSVVAVGISEDDLTCPVSLLSRKEVSLLGSRNSIDQFPAAIALARRHATALARTITHRFPLSEAEEAIRQVAGRAPGLGKVVVDVATS